jgi:general stress protein 26
MIKQHEAAKLWELVKPLKIAMLVSNHNKTLKARPMHLVQLEFTDTFYFFTVMPSEKTHEIDSNNEVCLSFSCPKEEVYVSISGQCKVTKNQPMINELWNPFVAAWFPQGKKDPSVGLIEVYPYQAEYWENNVTKINQLFKYAKALLTDELPDIGRHDIFS